MDKKLFLLDAYALIYRAYYALIRSPRITSKGFDTSAIFGFCNTLDEVLRKENPSHIAVCFDPKGGHTFRHELLADYKANRDAQPEGITNAVPYIKRILDAYHIPVIEYPDYEADDVIGTLSRKAQAEGYITYMMTPDKDFGQLVTDRVLMLRPSLRGKDGEIRGPKEVCERYGIKRPEQVIDLLALEGDAIDNIPGCPGVGEKTAQKLIAEFDSVDNLLNNIDRLKGALKTKVSDNVEQIKLSKVLATIRTDVPINVDIDSLERRPEDVDELRKLFTELEFNTWLRRLGTNPEPTAAQAQPNAQPSLFDFDNTVESAAPQAILTTADYTTASTPEQLTELLAKAAESPMVGIALIAAGESSMTARPIGIAIATAPGSARYFNIPADQQERATVMATLNSLFASKATIVSHDVKRDLLIMRNLGVAWTAPFYDTSVAHYLLQPESKHTLPFVAAAMLNYRTIDFGQESAKRVSPESLSPEEAAIRACEIADITLRLQPILAQALRQQHLDELLYQIELPLIPVLAEMEWTGVRIDVGELHKLSQQLTQRLREMEAECYNLAGVQFNISSPSQVGEILFDRLKIDAKAKRTKKGSYSTTEEILEKLVPAHPIVGLILKIRRLRKLLATYINALPALINPATGKIHTSYNQTVTATGRISSTNPNLQNIPVRTDDGREIRRAFIADPGDLFLSADYSQIELRLMADLSGDRDMIDAFLSGADFHQATAAKIYHLPLEQVGDAERRKAKTANFGIIYGISPFGLSERLGISRSEAKELIENYFRTYPGVRHYMDSAIEHARQDGYVTTITGRKRFLPDINSRNAVVRGYAERNAINAPLQGSAADIIKRAMIAVQGEITRRGLLSRMIMQVHDELIFNVKPDELPQLQEIVVTQMVAAYSGRVPMEVASGVGQNWLEAH